MILLLTGSSGTARDVIVATFLAEQPEFRHIDLQGLSEQATTAAELEEMDEKIANFAVDCLEATQNEGLHVLLSCPSPTVVPLVRNRLDDVRAVHLGDFEQSESEVFDRILDAASCSASDGAKVLSSLIA